MNSHISHKVRVQFLDTLIISVSTVAPPSEKKKMLIILKLPPNY